MTRVRGYIVRPSEVTLSGATAVSLDIPVYEGETIVSVEGKTGANQARLDCNMMQGNITADLTRSVYIVRDEVIAASGSWRDKFPFRDNLVKDGVVRFSFAAATDGDTLYARVVVLER